MVIPLVMAWASGRAMARAHPQLADDGQRRCAGCAG
jgi:hypothetical protein